MATGMVAFLLAESVVAVYNYVKDCMSLPLIVYVALLALLLLACAIFPGFARMGIIVSFVVAAVGGAIVLYLQNRKSEGRLRQVVKLYLQRLEQAHGDFVSRRQLERQIADLASFVHSDMQVSTVALCSRKKLGFAVVESHGIQPENLRQLRIGHRDELVKALEARRAVVSIRKVYASGNAGKQFDGLPFVEALPVITGGKCSHFILLSHSPVFPMRLIRPFLLSLSDQIANSRVVEELLNKHNQQVGKLRKEMDSLIREREQRSAPPIMDVKSMINAQDRLLRIRSREQLFGSLLHLVEEQFKVDFAFILMRQANQPGYEMKYSLNVGTDPAANLAVADVEAFITEARSRPGCKKLSQLAEVTKDNPVIEALQNAGVVALGILTDAEGRESMMAVGRAKSPFSDEELEAAYAFCRMFNLVLENQAHFEQIEQMSYTDSMTGLYNYRYFYKRLQEEILRAKRFSRHLALVIFDIDEFKVFNDTYGHQAGDYLLEQLGGLLAKSVRSIDVVSRYGGEEFCVIMPETSADDCTYFMERMRATVLNHEFKDRFTNDQHRVTVSLGGAIYPNDAQRIDRLIYCADMALLQAKAGGRNRSVMFDEKLLNSRSDLYDKKSID